MACVLLLLWLGRFGGMTLVRKRPATARPVHAMINADLVRAAAQLILLAILATNVTASAPAAISALGLSSFVYGFAAAFFVPARFSAISTLGAPSEYQRINSTLSIVGDLSAILGPVLGSLAVVWLGFQNVLLIDGVSFLVAATILVPLRATRTESASTPADDDDTPTPRTGTMPAWFTPGLATWGVLALTIGIIGVAGPTQVMSRFDVTGWTITATALGVGSLLASTSTLLGAFDVVRWRTLHVCALALAATEVAAFVAAPNVWILAAIGATGSMAVTVSGIRWDTMGQSLRTDHLVNEFATRDQLVAHHSLPVVVHRGPALPFRRCRMPVDRLRGDLVVLPRGAYFHRRSDLSTTLPTATPPSLPANVMHDGIPFYGLVTGCAAATSDGLLSPLDSAT